MKNQIDVETLLNLYESMLRIRVFEDAVSERYGIGEIPGFVHCYQGQEAVAAGVCAHLDRADIITSTHRGHGHVLAKGIPSRAMMAELYGKKDGCSGGRGGSMHAYQMDYGLLGTNGMVGGGLGLATGAAFAQKYKGTNNVAVSFFGDGASNMGIFYESLNQASIWKLPVIFVCENNLYATSTPLSEVAANIEIASRAEAFNMPGIAVDGSDVVEIFEIAGDAVSRARSGSGPTLIEAKTYRYHGHHEGDQIAGTYRTQTEIDDWKKKDPIDKIIRILVEEYQVGQGILVDIEADIKSEINDAVDFSKNSKTPAPESVLDFVFYKEK